MGMLSIAILELNYEALVPDVRKVSFKIIITFGTSYDMNDIRSYEYIYCAIIYEEAVGNLKMMRLFSVTQPKGSWGKKIVVMFSI